MKITDKWLEEKGACPEACDWIKEQDTRDLDTLTDLILKEDDAEKYSWACWGLSRIFNQKQKVRFSVYCAEKVLHIFEGKYPDDKRPREAILAAKKWLKNPTQETAYATYATGYAANAADAAAYAAAYATNAAFAADDKTKMYRKFVLYGRRILKEK